MPTCRCLFVRFRGALPSFLVGLWAILITLVVVALLLNESRCGLHGGQHQSSSLELELIFERNRHRALSQALRHSVEELRTRWTSGAAPTPQEKPENDRSGARNSEECSSEAAETDSLRIPKVVHLVWKNEMLNAEANTIDSRWRKAEPCLVRHVVDDHDCVSLAHRIDRLGPAYERLPLNVMRADTCRVLAVWAYGGIYMDLDVAPAMPFREWFNASQDIVLGKEVSEHPHMCNWFFAARPQHPCLLQALHLIRDRIDKPMSREAIVHDEGFVHRHTGPRAFYDGLKGCAIPTLTPEQVKHEFIDHQFGSLTWRSGGKFQSWQSARSLMKGSVAAKDGDSEVLWSEPLRVDGVSHKPVVEGCWIFGHPKFAFDNSRHTVAQADGAEPAFWLKFRGETVLAVEENGAAGRTEPGHSYLHCIDIHAVKGDGGSLRSITLSTHSRFGGGVSLSSQTSGKNATEFLRFRPRLNQSFSHSTPVVAIRIATTGKRLRVGEMRVFTDRACRTPRKVIFDDRNVLGRMPRVPHQGSRSVISFLRNGLNAVGQCPFVETIGDSVVFPRAFLCPERFRSEGKRIALLAGEFSAEDLPWQLAANNFAVHHLSTEHKPARNYRRHVRRGPLAVVDHGMMLAGDPVNPHETTLRDFLLLTGVPHSDLDVLGIAVRPSDALMWRNMVRGTTIAGVAPSHVILDANLCSDSDVDAEEEGTEGPFTALDNLLQRLLQSMEVLSAEVLESSGSMRLQRGISAPCRILLTLIRKL